MKTNKTEKPSTADKILTAASQLFYQEGIQAVGIDKITQEAGVALNTLYHHYPSKDKLVEAYLIRRDSYWMDLFPSRLETGAPLQENIAHLFEALSAWFHEDGFRGCAFINAVGETGETKPQIFEISRQHKEGAYQVVLRLCQEAKQKQPERLARKIMLLVEGSIVMAYMNKDPDVADDAKEAARCLIEHSC